MHTDQPGSFQVNRTIIIATLEWVNLRTEQPSFSSEPGLLWNATPPLAMTLAVEALARHLATCFTNLGRNTLTFSCCPAFALDKIHGYRYCAEL